MKIEKGNKALTKQIKVDRKQNQETSKISRAKGNPSFTLLHVSYQNNKWVTDTFWIEGIHTEKLLKPIEYPPLSHIK